MGDSDNLHPDLAGLVGSVLHDRYRVDALLGAGGMGAVFKAHHIGLDRDVALKVLHPEIARDPSTRKRFEREAKSASRLDHPNCVRVTDFSKSDDGPSYLVMEMLAGSELEARLGQAWPAQAAIDTAKQMFAGLEHAHAMGIVHRDLKPENVFLTKDYRGEELVKLVDFGIAKLLDEQGVEKLTRQGVVFGTPRYMSPEQAAGGKIDERTDLYAAGLILYEMLAGHPPFDADDAPTLLRMHIMAPPPALGPSVPPALAKIVEKLLEKSKGDRYASAREVIAALDAARAELGGAGAVAAAGVAVAAGVGVVAGVAAADATAAMGPGPSAATVSTSAPALSRTAIDASGSNPTRPIAPDSAQAARSGMAWQPSAAGSTTASHRTLAYLPPTGSHPGVGEMPTGSYDAVPSSATSRATWTDSYAALPQQPPVPERSNTIPVVEARHEDEQRRRSPLVWLAIAVVVLLGLAGIGYALSDTSDTSDTSATSSDTNPEPTGTEATVAAPPDPATTSDAATPPSRNTSQPSRATSNPSGSATQPESRTSGSRARPTSDSVWPFGDDAEEPAPERADDEKDQGKGEGKGEGKGKDKNKKHKR